LINLGPQDDDVKVGDTIEFKLGYPAMLRLMSSRYVEKTVDPPLDVFEQQLRSRPPVIKTGDMVRHERIGSPVPTGGNTRNP
jgi:hypothetical protein